MAHRMKSSLERPIMESRGQNWTNIGLDEDIILDLEEDSNPDKKLSSKPKSFIIKLTTMTKAMPVKNQKFKSNLMGKADTKVKNKSNLGIQSAESVDKTSHNYIKKRKKMPALNSLVPVNLFEEKRVFFENSMNYNPLFNYPEAEVKLPVDLLVRCPA